MNSEAAAGARSATQFDDSSQQHAAAELGMWVFLGTEVMFFGVLFFAYTVSRMHFPEAFAAASRHTSILLGTINTVVLLTSSLTMALAVDAVRSDRARTAFRFLLITALLGAVFLAIKASEYRDDYLQHLVPWLDFQFSAQQMAGARLFFYLYFVTTGLHAIHLSVGIGVVLVMAYRTRRHDFGSGYAAPVEVTGLYWHLIDIVWIFLYPALYLVSRAS